MTGNLLNTLRIIRKSLSLLVAVWALVVAGYYLFFAKVSFETTTASSTPGNSPLSTTSSGQISWLSQVGPLPVVVMLSLSLLLIAGAVTGWRGEWVVAVAISLLALAASYITGFSIGVLYFPGAVGLFLCSVVLLVENLSKRLNRPPA